jgi:hypothetical protein
MSSVWQPAATREAGDVLPELSIRALSAAEVREEHEGMKTLRDIVVSAPGGADVVGPRSGRDSSPSP